MVARAKAKAAEETTTVGTLVRTGYLTRKDVEAAAARLFDGRTPLPLANGHALIMPDLRQMTLYSREAIMTALLLANAAAKAE